MLSICKHHFRNSLQRIAQLHSPLSKIVEAWARGGRGGGALGYFWGGLVPLGTPDDIDKIYAVATLSDVLLHLRLTCITFTVGQLITFSVKLYNTCTYGGVSYYI